MMISQDHSLLDALELQRMRTTLKLEIRKFDSSAEKFKFEKAQSYLRMGR